jgi:hypothetical protein
MNGYEMEDGEEAAVQHTTKRQHRKFQLPTDGQTETL